MAYTQYTINPDGSYTFRDPYTNQTTTATGHVAVQRVQQLDYDRQQNPSQLSFARSGYYEPDTTQKPSYQSAYGQTSVGSQRQTQNKYGQQNYSPQQQNYGQQATSSQQIGQISGQPVCRCHSQENQNQTPSWSAGQPQNYGNEQGQKPENQLYSQQPAQQQTWAQAAQEQQQNQQQEPSSDGYGGKMKTALGYGFGF
jgi:hypothetical protein